jgi:hypothetical protein
MNDNQRALLLYLVYFVGMLAVGYAIGPCVDVDL